MAEYSTRADMPGEGGGEELRLLARLLSDGGGSGGGSLREILRELLSERRRSEDQQRERSFGDASGLSGGQKLHLQRLPKRLQAGAALTMEAGRRRNALRAAGLNPDAEYARGLSAAGKSEEQYVAAARAAKAARDEQAEARRRKSALVRAERAADPQRRPGTLTSVTQTPGGGYRGSYQVAGGPLRHMEAGSVDEARGAAASGLQRELAAADDPLRRLAAVLGGF